MKFSYTTNEIIKNFAKLIILLFIGYLYIKWPFYNYLHYTWSLWLWLFGLLILGTLLERFAMEIKNRVRGREAEDDVEEKLEDLPNDFVILSNLNIQNRGDIDKVVIGPTGIWVIEVKSHAGYISFDGNELTRDGEQLEKNFLSQVWAETFAVKDVLEEELKHKIVVQPVILFSDPDAKMKFGYKKINGVYIVGYGWINKLINNTVVGRLSYNEIDTTNSLLSKYCEKQ